MIFTNDHASFKWSYDSSVIYSDTSSTAAQVTVTQNPLKVVLRGAKLVAAVRQGAPAKAGVTLNGSITCPS